MPSSSKMAMGLLRAVALLALSLLGVELGARLEDLARFGTPLTSGASSLQDLLTRDSLGVHARPGAVYRQFRINSLGFRGPEVKPAEPHAQPLVITSGASETFGLYESRGQEWPAQLAESLRVRCGDRGVTVLNAAFAGMSLPTVIQDVRLRVLPMHPRVIAYYLSPEFYLYRAVPRPTPPLAGPVRPASAWRSRAYPRLRDAVKRAVPVGILDALRRVRVKGLRAAGETPFPSLPRDRLDSLEGHLRVLVGEVRAGGSQIVLGVHQDRFADTAAAAERRWLRAWEGQVPKATGRLLLAFDSLAAARVRKVAADSGVGVFDPALASRADRAALFADFSHLTDRGAAILAGAASVPVGSLLGCGSVPSASAPTPVRRGERPASGRGSRGPDAAAVSR